MRHELKTDSKVFEASWCGEKPYEIRFNDRSYSVGDVLVLRETVHTGAEMKAGLPLIYTGRTIVAVVKWMLHGPAYGLSDGWVIMSIPGLIQIEDWNDWQQK